MKDTVTVSAVRLLLGSLANIAREELGPRSSLVAMVAILVIVVLALAVLFPADDDQINLIPAAFADLMGKLKLEGGHRIAWVTLGPMLFVGTTTLTGAFLSVRDIFVPIWLSPKMSTDSFEGLLNPGLTVVMMTLVVLILLGAVPLSFRHWKGGAAGDARDAPGAPAVGRGLRLTRRQPAARRENETVSTPRDARRAVSSPLSRARASFSHS